MSEIKVAEKPTCGDKREFEIDERVTVINTQDIGNGYTGTVTEKNTWLHDPRNNRKWYQYRVAFPPYTMGGIIYMPENLITATNSTDKLTVANQRAADLEAALNKIHRFALIAAFADKAFEHVVEMAADALNHHKRTTSE